MRIALVNNFFLPRASGSAHQVAQLASEFSVKGHEVLVLTAAQGVPAGVETVNGYRVRRLACVALPPLDIAMRYDVNFAFSIRNVRSAYRQLDEFQPDVVHQHGQFFDLTWISGLWARSRGCPAALTIHTPLVHVNYAYAAAMWAADVSFIRHMIQLWSPQLLAVDARMRDYVARRYKKRLEDVHVIPLGIDPRQMRGGDGARVRRELGIGNRPMVLSLGHVIPLRDRLFLVEALPRLADECPDVVVVVVGMVNDDRFLKRAEALRVSDRIIITGQVPFSDVPSFIAAADVECHEDGVGSGLGTATLEVMAAGTPVVAVAGADSFVGFTLRNWEELVLVQRDSPEELSSALAKVLSDRHLAKRIGSGGRTLIENRLTARIAAENHLGMYEKIRRVSRNSVVRSQQVP